MILQALVRYYEDLLARSVLSAPGWTNEKVCWGLELTPDGQIAAVYDLQNTVTRGKKTVRVPKLQCVPDRVKRTVSVVPNFLCDNSSYILGVDAKGSPERSLQCFNACHDLHLAILKDLPGPAAAAVCRFFETWQPEHAAEDPVLSPFLPEILKGGNLVFLGPNSSQCVADDDNIRAAWQQYNSRDTAADLTRCLVTGKLAPMARLHPVIKGVVGAQSSGASLVSFNAESFCSYGHEQGANAPVSSYAAFAYTQALNYLLSDAERQNGHIQRVGDTTVVCWAEGGSPAAQDMAQSVLFCNVDILPDNCDFSWLYDLVNRLAHGKAADWQGALLDPNTPFYVLGLAPNAARLSVRFFFHDTLGQFAKNVQKYYTDIKIIRPSYDRFEYISPYWLLQETVNKKASNPAPAPQLNGSLLDAVLKGTPFPATLLNNTTLRIRAEHTVTRGRAAILKGYYLRLLDDSHPMKEVLTVELNKDSQYLPYVLGRLFSIFESIQSATNPNLNTTIKDRYFNAASSTPANVFPVLMNLAQKHMQKLSDAQKVYYNKQITDLLNRIDKTLPTRFTLVEQGAFQIGYYHQTQDRFTKKEEV